MVVAAAAGCQMRLFMLVAKWLLLVWLLMVWLLVWLLLVWLLLVLARLLGVARLLVYCW